MFAPVKSEKKSADFSGIARNFGGITRTQLQISTAHENSAVLKIVGNFFCFLPFCDSCAEMQFWQKFPKRIPHANKWWRRVSPELARTSCCGTLQAIMIQMGSTLAEVLAEAGLCSNATRTLVLSTVG